MSKWIQQIGSPQLLIFSGLAAVAAVAALAPAIAHAALPVVPRAEFGSVLVKSAAALSGVMTAYYDRPNGWSPETGRVLVVLHGIDRDARGMRDEFRPIAEQTQMLVIVPEFSETNFPSIYGYNLGHVLDEGGHPMPPASWTFGAVDDAVDTVRNALGGTHQDYVLFGFSAGAQFAHRGLLLTGLPRAKRIIIAASGWFTLPRRDLPFPAGISLQSSPMTSESFLSRETVVLVGAKDRDRGDPGAPSRFLDLALKQGSDRVTRSQVFMAEGFNAASAHGLYFGWQRIVAPGIGHDAIGLAGFALSTGLFRD